MALHSLISLVWLSALVLLFPSHLFCFPGEYSEKANGEGDAGAETKAAEVRAEPPGVPDQRAGPAGQNGGRVLI